MTNFDEAKGKIKQAAGDLTDDPELKREGEHDETEGKVKELIDNAKDKIEDAVDAVKDKFKKD